jgi:hypothetical protein
LSGDGRNSLKYIREDLKSTINENKKRRIYAGKIEKKIISEKGSIPTESLIF